MQGSAAEALGLIGDAAAADAIGRFVGQVVQSGALAQAPATKTTMPGAIRRRRRPASRIYALVRLKAYPQLAAAVLDGSGQPRVRWWPVAYALQRLEDRAGAAGAADAGEGCSIRTRGRSPSRGWRR